MTQSSIHAVKDAYDSCRTIKIRGGFLMEKRQLCKSDTNRKLCGVCGGLGEYFNVDPTIIRLAFAGFTLLYGGGLWIYLIAALVLPGEGQLR